MRIPARFTSRPKLAADVSLVSGPATVTLPANLNEGHVLLGFHVTYDGGAPGAQDVTVTLRQNGTLKVIHCKATFTAGVTSIWDFKQRFVGDVNTTMTIVAPTVIGQIVTLEVFYN